MGETQVVRPEAESLGTAPFSIGRSLFAKTPPSIVIIEPQPRWKVWAQRTARGVLLLLGGAACFYAGVLYERQQAPRPVVRVQADVPQGEPAASSRAGALPQAPKAPALAELMEKLALEGLDIQGLEIVADPRDPTQLRYQFTVLNTGRRYEGTLEFLVLGVRNGHAVSWVYPQESERAQPRFQMRVGRYVKTEGIISLPADLRAQAVAVRLREASGIRASQGVLLAAAAETGATR